MYGRLIAGYLRTVKSESGGGKPVVFTMHEDPPTGYQYKLTWAETDDSITQDWVLEKLPDDIDGNEAMEIILGGAT